MFRSDHFTCYLLIDSERFSHQGKKKKIEKDFDIKNTKSTNTTHDRLSNVFT